MAAGKFRPVRTTHAAHFQTAAKTAGFSETVFLADATWPEMDSAKRAVADSVVIPATTNAVWPAVTNAADEVATNAVWQVATNAADAVATNAADGVAVRVQVELVKRQPDYCRRTCSANSWTNGLDVRAANTAVFTSAVFKLKITKVTR